MTVRLNGRPKGVEICVIGRLQADVLSREMKNEKLINVNYLNENRRVQAVHSIVRHLHVVGVSLVWNFRYSWQS